jgi:uncharacterized membrane protein YfcA
MDPLIIVFGLSVGLLVGLTGAGGGSLMTPLLILLFGVNVTTAVGTDLFHGAVTKTAGAVKHLRQRTVDIGLSGWMWAGSLPASLVGVFGLNVVRHHVPGFNQLLMGLLAGALLLTGVAVLARVFYRPEKVDEVQTVRHTRRTKLVAASMGAFVGLIIGATSVGSGTLIAVALILVFRLIPTRVVGTDIFHAGGLLWVASVAQAILGNIDYGLAATILIGSVPGVWLGSHWAVRVPTTGLRGALGIVVLGSGVALLSKAGAHVPTAVVAAVPGLLVVWLAGAWYRQKAKGPSLEAEH